MQLAIDILVETPAALRLAAQFLLDHAAMREAMEGADTPQTLKPAGAVIPPPAPPAPPAPPSDLAHAIIPPPPPPPAAPPAPAAVVAPLPPAAVAPAALEYDKAGVPWDARIHQKNKNQKKDHTWKLQKGINPQLVEAVMRELTPLIRAPGVAPATDPNPAAVFGQTPLPVGASAPVPLPPPPPVSPVSPAVAAALAGQAAPPAPAAPQAPITTPGAEGPTADPFRALVSKITKARAANRITPEEVTQCVAGAGAPTLQLLNSMPHLIPHVEAGIDAILAMR